MTKTKTLIFIGVLLGFATVGAAITLSSSQTAPISDGVTVESPSGMEVKYWDDTNVSMESMFPSSDTVEIVSDDGNITFKAASSAHAEIHTGNVTGTWTNVTGITAGSTWIEIYPENNPRADVQGGLNEFSITSYSVDDNNADFYYSGPDSGSASVRLYNLPANSDIGAFDTSTGTLLDGAMTDNNGNATFNLPTSSHTVELQTTNSQDPILSNPVPPDASTIRYDNETFEIDVSDPEFPDGDSATVTIDLDGSQIHSESISSNSTVTTSSQTGLSEGSHTWTVAAEDSYGNTVSQSYTFTVDHYDPEILNPSPVGDLDANPSNIDADIRDADFNKDGDSLDVTLELDGSQIHSETISGNQTVSASIPQSGLTGGEHTYTWTVEDQWGETTERTETYSVPDTLYVRNELNHSDILGSPISLNVTFFGEENIYSRTTSDGTLEMTGLPVNQDYIAVARPSDGNWTTRALYVTSIYEQQSLYLLNTSAVPTIESRFTLQDPTGQYGSTSVVAIQRPIEINGTTSWQTVHADQFGTEGVTVTLEEDQRYRVKVIAQDGTQQIVGPYRSDVSETVEVVPGAPEIDIPTFEDGYGYNAGIENVTFEYRYDDPENETDKLTVWIHEKGNTSNQLVANSTFFDIGSAYNQFTTSVNESKKTWVVNFVISRNGETIVQTVEVANNKDLFGQLAPGLQVSLGVVLLLLLAGSFSVLNAGVGAVVVSMAAGVLWWIGLLSGVTSAILIAIAIFVSVVYAVAKSSGP